MSLESFKHFLSESSDLDESCHDGIPVVSVEQPETLQDRKNEINRDLSEVTDVTYTWPLAGFEAISDVLKEHGLTICEDLPNPNEDTDEIVYGIEGTDPNLFLYLFYESQDSEHKIEFYAEIVNEEELNQLMDEIDVGENDNDDEDEDGDEYDNDA